MNTCQSADQRQEDCTRQIELDLVELDQATASMYLLNKGCYNMDLQSSEDWLSDVNKFRELKELHS